MFWISSKRREQRQVAAQERRDALEQSVRDWMRLAEVRRQIAATGMTADEAFSRPVEPARTV